MLGEIFDKTIDGVIDYINNLKRLYLDHDHDGLNSKTVSNKSEVVDIASAQTITGLKTFSLIPKIPTGDPTADAEVISKAYYDVNTVKQGAINQNIGGVKTFTNFPKIPSTDPTDNQHPISKKYIDDNYTKNNATSLAGKSWFLDEDNFVSDSDTKVPSQQSVKAYIDALGVHDTSKIIYLTASNNLRASADTNRETSSTSYVKLKEIKIRREGSIRVKFDMIVVGSNNFGTGFAKVYKNGSAVGTEREQTSQSSAPYTYTTYSEDFNITRAEINANVDGVKIQIYAYVNNILYATKIENFRIYYDRDYSVDYEVITN